MAVWLFTWNPAKWIWTDYDEECQETAEGRSIVDAWSCLSKKIRIGDEFYLAKLGKPPRGIIAHGVIIGDIFEERHWDDEQPSKITNYVPGEWDILLNYKTQKILDMSLLDEKCPQQCWHPQASGIRIKDEVLPVLKELWAEVTENYHDNFTNLANPEDSIYTEGSRKYVYTTKYERTLMSGGLS